MEEKTVKSRTSYRKLGTMLVILLSGLLIIFTNTAEAKSSNVLLITGFCGDGTCDLGETYLNCPSDCSPPTSESYEGMKRKGACKLMEINDGYLGSNLTAIIKGSPSVLKLKADGKTYELPLVPGSVVANGDGTYTAQFYTIDPVTGQALVPAGDYTARCHGTGGSNDGGSANTVSIGY